MRSNLIEDLFSSMKAQAAFSASVLLARYLWIPGASRPSFSIKAVLTVFQSAFQKRNIHKVIKKSEIDESGRFTSVKV